MAHLNWRWVLKELAINIIIQIITTTDMFSDDYLKYDQDFLGHWFEARPVTSLAASFSGCSFMRDALDSIFAKGHCLDPP